VYGKVKWSTPKTLHISEDIPDYFTYAENSHDDSRRRAHCRSELGSRHIRLGKPKPLSNHNHCHAVREMEGETFSLLLSLRHRDGSACQSVS